MAGKKYQAEKPERASRYGMATESRFLSYSGLTVYEYRSQISAANMIQNINRYVKMPIYLNKI